MKSAVITPLLKKPGLDPILKNYRPVSNLAFLSKVLERVVAVQLRKHLDANNLCDPFQSAYRAGHSTETALLSVHNDLLCTLDRGDLAVLVLLDLSAAFDTVDHTILLNRLQKRIGLQGVVLDWVKSYLTDRCQSVSVQSCQSPSTPLNQGVPQGSVLGPLLFTTYTLPIGDIARKHNIKYHLYADDTQLYISFKPKQGKISMAKLTEVISDLRHWMANNYLKLNDSKTEVILVGTKQQCKKVSIPHLTIGDVQIKVSREHAVRNIGAWFDSQMSMKQHIKTVCQVAHYHLRRIGQIRPYLSKKATECLIHAFISSRLDYANSLLYGLPMNQIRKLQGIQNIAARIVSKTRKSDHITPVLAELHWLPVASRIKFKVLLLVFKAINNLGPTYLKDLIVPHIPTRTLRSSTQSLLRVPPTRLVTCGDRAFCKAGPACWNALPIELRETMPLNTFKQSLKTYLFRSEYCEHQGKSVNSIISGTLLNCVRL